MNCFIESFPPHLLDLEIILFELINRGNKRWIEKILLDELERYTTSVFADIPLGSFYTITS
jgi:hypothetical protein